jgi:carboxypeptidase Taq
MLEGTLKLPAARRMARAHQSDLGITPPDDRDGALQDVHWYGGIVGGAFRAIRSATS